MFFQDSEPSLEVNIYHKLYLFWSFENKNKYISSLLSAEQQSYIISTTSFYASRVPTLLSKRQTEENVNASFLVLLSRRIREGYTVNVTIFLHSSFSNGQNLFFVINCWIFKTLFQQFSGCTLQQRDDRSKAQPPLESVRLHPLHPDFWLAGNKEFDPLWSARLGSLRIPTRHNLSDEKRNQVFLPPGRVRAVLDPGDSTYLERHRSEPGVELFPK